MLEEIKTFIERLKSDFHLDEIEKSLYFVNQKKILNKRLENLNEKIADLNEQLGESEKNNGGFKVRSNTVPLLMAIRQEKDKQQTLQKEYDEEVEIFKRGCKLDIQDTEIQTYSYEQIACLFLFWHHTKKRNIFTSSWFLGFFEYTTLVGERLFSASIALCYTGSPAFVGQALWKKVAL